MNIQESNFFIGIDVGTQGIRTGILDRAGKILSIDEEMYETVYPQIGWAEQNPEDWWKAFKVAFGKCLDKISSEVRSNIKSISVCATSSTVIPVDSEGNPLMNAILWMDSRAQEETKLINDTNSEVLKYCGGEVSVEWMLPKTLWLKRNRPEIYNKAYKIVEELDFFNYRLTGKWVSSICNTTCKWNYVHDCGGWNEEFMKSIGLEDFKEKLPVDVKKVGEVLGKIDKNLANELEINDNVLIIQGGVDAHIAMLGMGVVSPGKMATIMGTSFVHLTLSTKPIFQNGIWGPYNKAVLDDYWLLEGGQISAGSITKWFINEFNISVGNAYGEMAAAAEKIPMGSEGVVVLDFFQGNRTPYKNPKAKGTIYGLNLKHTNSHVYRAVLESVAFGTKNIIDNFKKQGCEVDTLVACGGVTKNPLWIQIISDVTGIPIIINKNTDAGITGCCLLSAVSMGIYKDYVTASDNMIQVESIIRPDKVNTKAYEKNYEKYLKIYDSLKNIMEED